MACIAVGRKTIEFIKNTIQEYNWIQNLRIKRLDPDSYEVTCIRNPGNNFLHIIPQGKQIIMAAVN